MIEVALVGCGHMGGLHARTIAANPATRLVAVVDPHPDRAASLAHRTGARAVREVPTEVDAVVVATPASTHGAVARGPLAAGRWCLVEKPVTLGVAELDGLPTERLVAGMSERFNPAVRARGTTAPTRVAGRRASRPDGRASDVDVVRDLMIHDLDLLGWWLGDADPRPVRARGRRGTSGRWEEVEAELVLGDIPASLWASRLGGAERWLRCETDTGEVVLDLVAGTAGGPGIHAPGPGDALTAQWAAFVALVEGGTSHAARAADARRAHALADRILNALEVNG